MGLGAALGLGCLGAAMVLGAALGADALGLGAALGAALGVTALSLVALGQKGYGDVGSVGRSAIVFLLFGSLFLLPDSVPFGLGAGCACFIGFL